MLNDDVQFVTCTIGSGTKMTTADWHVERSEDLVEVLN